MKKCLTVYIFFAVARLKMLAIATVLLNAAINSQRRINHSLTCLILDNYCPHYIFTIQKRRICILFKRISYSYRKHTLSYWICLVPIPFFFNFKKYIYSTK